MCSAVCTVESQLRHPCPGVMCRVSARSGAGGAVRSQHWTGVAAALTLQERFQHEAVWQAEVPAPGTFSALLDPTCLVSLKRAVSVSVRGPGWLCFEAVVSSASLGLAAEQCALRRGRILPPFSSWDTEPHTEP